MKLFPDQRSLVSTRVEFATSYLDRLQRLLLTLDGEAIASFISKLMEARERGTNIFFIGNGGSASTASHFANDLSIGTRSVLKPFRAVSLADNVSILTAIANDFGYEQVFVKQLQVLLKPNDLVVAISASGNSPNLLKAVEYAKHAGAFSVGITGFDGGKLRPMVDLSVHVPSNHGEYGPVEDVHLVLDHLIAGCIAKELRAEREKDEATASLIPADQRTPLENPFPLS